MLYLKFITILDFLLCYHVGVYSFIFTFRSMFHFELISVNGVRSVLRFICLHVGVQLL